MFKMRTHANPSVSEFVQQESVKASREILSTTSWKKPVSILWGLQDKWLDFNGVEKFAKSINARLVQLEHVSFCLLKVQFYLTSNRMTLLWFILCVWMVSLRLVTMLRRISEKRWGSQWGLFWSPVCERLILMCTPALKILILFAVLIRLFILALEWGPSPFLLIYFGLGMKSITVSAFSWSSKL